MRTRILGTAGVLVFVSAAIHLALGITGLAEAISEDGSMLLPVLYLLGGLAALALLGVIALTPATTTAYAAGAGLMVLFLVAYADIHAFGVAESTLGAEFHDHGGGHAPGDEGHSHDHSGEGHTHDHGGDGHSHGQGDGGNVHSHDEGTTGVLGEHLRDDAYALVSKTAEAGAAVIFGVLLALDR